MNRMSTLWIALVVVLLVTACGPESATTAAPASTGKTFDVNNFVGRYEGTWTNTANGATGPVSIDITADEEAHTASLTIDFDGPYLGLEDPPAQTLDATYDDTMAVVDTNSPLFGDVHVTIDADGNIVGLMQNLAGGLIPEMSYTGVVGSGRLDADYVVKFADGNTVNSILRMTKQ